MSLTDICQPKTFTLVEANAIIPLLNKITERHEQEVENIMKDQRWLMKSGASQGRITECDTKVGQQLIQWGTKLAKLGCQVYGQGYVGLDSGSFFWSWHKGENTIGWMHHYDELPFQRRPIMLLLTNPGVTTT